MNKVKAIFWGGENIGKGLGHDLSQTQTYVTPPSVPAPTI